MSSQVCTDCGGVSIISLSQHLVKLRARDPDRPKPKPRAAHYLRANHHRRTHVHPVCQTSQRKQPVALFELLTVVCALVIVTAVLWSL
jgi:hypothetical protein